MKNIKSIFGCVGLVFVLVAGMVIAQEDGLSDKAINRAVIRVDSLSCGGCFPAINAGLASLEGYSGMGANLFRKLIAVDFTQPLTAEQISAKLSEVGYPGAVESVDQISTEESFAYLESKQSGFGSSGGRCCGGRPGVAVSGSAGNQGACCNLPGVLNPAKDI